MKTLVVYASKYGSTREIAEFIAEKLRHQGMEAEAASVGAAPRARDYDAVVVGSGVYMGHWLREATEFVRQNRAVLADRPVWLFSSGPLHLPAGTESLDDPELQPEEIGELREAVRPRDTRVFFGALDPAQLGFGHRMIRKLPAGRDLLPEGDFRDWDDIAAWADGIARALAVPAA
ncbi:protoporphyrinogen oxidase [Methanoculleus sp. FWC-SCC1]|uniref:Protoporphyrinogen oxidase n=1 Tax=Methanoculleus frigidifontis TaxID=2584085 RepID=A0ABT8M7C0_9EURY|nr:flavodoxin domain-containing protein [Methanoculleus sp. FWC-SCC1]MDN7023832.1 protoporphyrinogen oxidase [Methanoculleus sp. FWC-SCC1]